MKNKIMAVIMAVVMIITVFVPLTISAATTNSTQITLSMGTPEKKTVNGKDYIAVPIEVSGNTQELFVLSYRIMSKEGLVPGRFEDGTINYNSITMDTTASENTYDITQQGYTGYKVLMDSSSGTQGLLTQSGNVGTAWFEISKDLDTYTFTLESIGADYIFDVSGGKKDTAKYTVSVGGNVTYVTECDPHTEVADTVNSKAATCTANGVQVTKCSVCGVEISRTTIAKLGHNIVADTANSKAATCAVPGVEAKKCTRCDYTETKGIATTGKHNFVSGKCSVCGIISGTPEITFSLGTPVKKTENGKNYVAIPIEMTDNANELFVLSYRVMSEDGLTPYKFENGTINYNSITMDTAVGKNPADITALGYTGYSVLMDSSAGAEGLLAQSGNIGTVWFELPESAGKYTFVIENLSTNCIVDDADGKPQVVKYVVRLGGEAGRAVYEYNTVEEVNVNLHRYTTAGDVIETFVGMPDEVLALPATNFFMDKNWYTEDGIVYTGTAFPTEDLDLYTAGAFVDEKDSTVIGANYDVVKDGTDHVIYYAGTAAQVTGKNNALPVGKVKDYTTYKVAVTYKANGGNLGFNAYTAKEENMYLCTMPVNGTYTDSIYAITKSTNGNYTTAVFYISTDFYGEYTTVVGMEDKKTIGGDQLYLTVQDTGSSALYIKDIVLTEVNGVVSDGAAKLKDDAAETEGWQAIRFYFNYNYEIANEKIYVVLGKDKYELVGRGFIYMNGNEQALDENNSFTLNSAYENMAVFYKDTELNECWAATDKVMTFSTYVYKFTEEYIDEEIMIKGYLTILVDGQEMVIYSDTISRSVDAVENYI